MEASGGSTITINIKCGVSAPSNIQFDSQKSIGDLRKILSEKYSAPFPMVVLIHKGRVLKEDSQSVTASGVADNDTILIWIKSQSNSQAKPTPNPSTTQSPNVQNSPFNLGNLGGVQGLQNMGFGSHNFSELQQRMTRELMSNPESFRTLMESPVVQNLFSNPETLQSIMQTNPQLREILDNNPDLAHAINNPEMMRETLELANNPSMLAEMMRNYDRSLSNLENIPGGMGELQRMYADVEEPMRQAVAEMSSQRQSQTNIPPPAVPGDSMNQPLPNLWASTPAPNISQQGVGNAGLESFVQQAMENPDFMRNMMQSSYMSSMLESFSSSPEMLRNMVDSMPATASNPQLKEQIVNNMPIMLQQMRNPTVQQMLSNPRAMAALLKVQEGMQELAAEAPQFVSSITDMSGIFNSGQQNISRPVVTQTPRERYASQLQQLAAMGFINTEMNIQGCCVLSILVLDRVSGDINMAIDILLNQRF